MTTKSYIATGRPSYPFSHATTIAKYLPAIRTPYHPHSFNRNNVNEDEFQQRFWLRGRGYTGPGHPNSGYFSGSKTYNMWDTQVPFIPKQELEKFMPDINLGPKALVTPVSVMSARHGHRVTHDLLHSYDRFVGKYHSFENPVVDHDNITVQDPKHVGLHADTLGCRARIFRWLRRGPFFNEDHYFRRSAQGPRGIRVDSEHERPLYAKIVHLAQRGQLKAACEEYRRAAFIPPVEVYRALTHACISKAKLADAVAIYEEGSSRLLYTARDYEVIRNVMLTAIAADHAPRVMWIYNSARGTFHENVVVRAPLERHQLFRLASTALEFMLDKGRTAEARTLLSFIEEDGLADFDLHEQVGIAMRAALEAGKKINVSDAHVEETAAQKAARLMAAEVARVIHSELHADLKHFAHDGAGAVGLDWLQSFLGADLNVLFALRLARLENGVDLIKVNRERYVARACHWLKQLSEQYQQRVVHTPLPLLRKSKPSAINPNLRVAADPAMQRRKRLTPTADGFSFFYGGETTRFVTESYPQRGETLQSQFLALQPTYANAVGIVEQDGGRLVADDLDELRMLPTAARRSPTVLHPSVTQRGGAGPAMSATAAAAAASGVAAAAPGTVDATATVAATAAATAGADGRGKTKPAALRDVQRSSAPSDDHFN